MNKLVLKPYKVYERDIKKQILSYLHFKNIYAWNNRNTGLYNPKSGKFIPAVMKGIPDILGFLGIKWGALAGKFICIEVKSRGGTVSPYQWHFINEAKNNNCVSIIAYCVEDVSKILDELEKIK